MSSTNRLETCTWADGSSFDVTEAIRIIEEPLNANMSEQHWTPPIDYPKIMVFLVCRDAPLPAFRFIDRDYALSDACDPSRPGIAVTTPHGEIKLIDGAHRIYKIWTTLRPGESRAFGVAVLSVTDWHRVFLGISHDGLMNVPMDAQKRGNWDGCTL